VALPVTQAVVVKLPLAGVAQDEQVRSVNAFPSAETNWVLTQVVLALQTVAGSMSWSQVPLAQATAAARSPAQ
jgi:predicted negative regulator of RcsB-dependent stress response